MGFVAGEAGEGVGFIFIIFEVDGQDCGGREVLGNVWDGGFGSFLLGGVEVVIMSLSFAIIGLGLVFLVLVEAIDQFAFDIGDSSHSPEGLGDAFGEDVFHGGFGV